MIPIDQTETGQTESLAFLIELPHPPAKVWRALTEPALLSEWLLPIIEPSFKLEAGAGFTLQAPPQPGWDGLVNARFLEIEAQRKLSYSWLVGELDTVVTFSITPTESGTRLLLVQSGFRQAQKKNWGGARYGWKMMIEKLADLLGRVP